MEYNNLANTDSLETTRKSLENKGYKVVVVENGNEALEKIKSLIPEKASIMNGSSETLEEIGFVNYLKEGKHGWNNFHEKIFNKEISRKEALNSDYYLGSVHALTEDGQMIIASGSGSQIPHLAYTSQNLILVVGSQKIVPNLDAALKRLNDYVVPLENKRMMAKHGFETRVNKILIFVNENPKMDRNINIILVKENLGF